MRELLFILTEGTPGQNTRPGERNSIQKTREEDKCYAVNHRDKELRLAMTVCSRNKITARMSLVSRIHARLIIATSYKYLQRRSSLVGCSAVL